MEIAHRAQSSTDLEGPRTFPPMPREQLRGVERLAVPMLERLNRTGWVKALSYNIIGRADSWFIRFITGKLWEVHGIEHARLEAPHGVILVSNHRSFFDMYICSAMLHFESRIIRRGAVYPVRSKFFYDHLAGLMLNMTISGGSMWPPVFRDEARRPLNRLGLEQIAAFLGPGLLIGIHPEGKRGKGDDPYELLPTKAGLGRLVNVCHPGVRVLPFFTLGLSNSFKHEVRRNFRKAGERGEPVRIRFGESFAAGDLHPMGDPQAITDRVMARIRELGEVDRRDMAENPRQA